MNTILDPSNTFFIGDLHFEDKDIISYEQRPFSDVDGMNKYIITNWNKVIRDEDIVFILGDVGKLEYLKQLKGFITIIRGNHDTFGSELCDKYNLINVYNFPIIINDYFILSHEPVYVNKYMPYMNIFAHVHGSPIYSDYSRWHYCVSAERIGYRPMSLQEILTKTLYLELIKEEHTNENSSNRS